MWLDIRRNFDAMLALYPEQVVCIVPEKDGDYPFPDQPNDWATPFIEIRGREFHYIARERGVECLHKSTDNPDELMSWIYHDYTRWLVSRYELRHRLPDEDSRRQWMALHVRLLRRANGIWADQVRDHYDGVLLRHPFSDHATPNRVEEARYQIPYSRSQ